MSEYNDLFDFSATQPGFDVVGPEYPPPPANLAHSAAWTMPLHPAFGAMEGDTAAAQLQQGVGPAPEGAGSHRVPWHACAVCLEPYQTDSALHRHAIEAQHQAYRCKCGTGFSKASALRRHVETKDAVKTFACALCPDRFARKDKLKDHCRHYHKVTDHGLRVLFSSLEVNQPRAPGAATRRRRAPALPRVAAASSGSPAASPAHAPVWPRAASTDQQYTNAPAGLSIPTGPLATINALQVPDSISISTGQFASSADAFAVDPALDGEFSGMLDDILGDYSWAEGFDAFDV
ncbi:hypothetical protein KVR01_012111 [Diaporthe batatas]|uniref:uncharacterized protein n=1 Tax=Diaporthe batatas TaxID=748121 RepID=UPI001D03FDB3|nr:uncharacterized protein KVR01_012111 [Diaporthe batatas]KAG8158350.1 hypothetical protein KVR01_012111 [Diaporthe batatas]